MGSDAVSKLFHGQDNSPVATEQSETTSPSYEQRMQSESENAVFYTGDQRSQSGQATYSQSPSYTQQVSSVATITYDEDNGHSSYQ